jgi:hypothetical protein
MTKEEQEYQKTLLDAGVDVEGVNAPTDDQDNADAEAKAKEEADAKAKSDADEKAKADEGDDSDSNKKPDNLPDEKGKKRSIYDEYKDKKSEARTEKERADNAERERDELKTKLEALQNADTPKDKQDALDELEKFAQETDADPAYLKKFRDLILKDINIKPDESMKKDLEEFKAWKSDNQKNLDQSNFESEFNKATSSLKELFPTATDDEMKTIKGELNKLAHSVGWNDKELEYIAFKNKTNLNALISPKKRGMENRDKKEGDEISTEFDPNADYSSLSPKEREVWEKGYKEMSKKSSGLTTDSSGKKIFI